MDSSFPPALSLRLYLANRAPELYPDPEQFRPERFLQRNPDTFTWLPFGAGVRRCVGAAWAEFEMRIVMQRVLARTELELLDPAPEFGKWRAVAIAPGQTRAIMHRRDRLAAD
jgi:cytochrome P450